MNRIVKHGFLVALGLAFFAPLTASADVSVEYGIVVAVDEVEEDDNVASGALVGGLLGAVVGPRDFGLNPGVVVGAAAGAAVDASNTDMHYEYTVELIGSGDEILISTEQDDIYEDNCVSLERGEHANIRKVSSWHCEDETEEPPEHHSQMASQCDQAKQLLVAAESEDEINAAVQKVRVLCED